jgi:cold shock CspA family protein
MTYCEERPNQPLAVAVESKVRSSLGEEQPQPTTVYAVGLSVPDSLVAEASEAALLAAVRLTGVQADISPATMAGTTLRELSVVGSPQAVQDAVAALSALVGEEHVQMASEPASVPFAAFSLTAAADRHQGWAGTEWTAADLAVHTEVPVSNHVFGELTAGGATQLKQVVANFRSGGPIVGTSSGPHWVSTGTVVSAGEDSGGVWGATITPEIGGANVAVGLCAVADGQKLKVGHAVEYFQVNDASGNPTAVHTARVGAPAAAARSRGVVTRESSRTVGTVFRWEADRGFGFIQPLDGSDPVYYNRDSIHANSAAKGGDLVVGDDVVFDKVLNETKGSYEAAFVTGPADEPVHAFITPETAGEAVPFAASASVDPTNGPAPRAGDTLDYTMGADGTLDHFIAAVGTGFILNAVPKASTTGTLADTSASVQLTGHPSAVQWATEQIARVGRSEQLPQLYLQAYVSSVDSSEIKQLVKMAAEAKAKELMKK